MVVIDQDIIKNKIDVEILDLKNRYRFKGRKRYILCLCRGSITRMKMGI
ncbi:hypothetical protein HMPREF1987_02336 [Peptostreptococcaceae bacterium oral taxon 113 str. W5053]|nr:hypothetical protein HMPREF1987_02336 [Peptostreptococcaceae bacterium oral taxon 113 str. W5053]